jgi:adenosine deaminase CECR1
MPYKPSRQNCVLLDRVVYSMEQKYVLLCLCHAAHQLGRQVIYTIVRMITPEDLEWYLEDCLSLKQKYPDVLAGPYRLRRQHKS